MTGTIETLKATYAFARGEDRVSYFIIPSGLQVTQRVTFDDLKLGMRVDFIPIMHPKGPRAIEVRVLKEDHDQAEK